MTVINNLKVKQSVFQVACKICEHPDAKIVHSILERHFGKSGAVLLSQNALKKIENLKSISVPRGDDEIEAEIISKGTGNFAYWSDGGWTDISQDDVTQYQLDFCWMLRWIATALRLPGGTVIKTLVDQRIWSLGEIKLKNRKAHVIFLRRPRSVEVIKALNVNLKEKYKGKSILIITTAQYIESFALAGNSYMAYIGDLMTNDEHLKFDMDIMHAQLFGVPAGTEGFGSGFRTAYFNGEKYSFTKIQAAIIETLHERGKPLHKTEFMPLHSTQDDPKFIFRSKGKYHPAWDKIIKFDNQGNYWLES